MAKYSVYMFCDACSQPHSMGIVIESNDVPPKEMRLKDLYSGGYIPPNFVLRGNSILCPETGQIVTQTDETMVFTVLIEE